MTSSPFPAAVDECPILRAGDGHLLTLILAQLPRQELAAIAKPCIADHCFAGVAIERVQGPSTLAPMTTLQFRSL
jgi:hypothetical protein